MKKKSIDNAKLGLFVLAGALFLVLTLYMIGKNRNLLGSTFTIKAKVTSVNGLVPGNNVRFKGIDVGTVKEILIADDTTIFVVMTLEKKIKKYIKQNAIVSIGTDGLMGNKLINIDSQPGDSGMVEEGGILSSRTPIETDAMLRTLNTTNDNIAVIADNLKEITGKLNNSNSLWNLLADTLISRDLKLAVADIRKAGANTANFTKEAEYLVKSIKNGEGLVGTILTDTLLTQKLENSLTQIAQGSQQAADVVKKLNQLIERVEKGEGTTGKLIADTLWSDQLHQSILNVEQGTSRFNENMEALKHNFLFRNYFKKQEKAKKKK